jgi:HlyD family secretion protein
MKNLRIVLVLVIIVLAFVVWSSTRRNVIPIRVEKAVKQTILDNFSTNGKVEPVEMFQSFALAPAIVRKVNVRNGDVVKAGTLLVQLDDTDAKAQVAKAEAMLRSAESDLAEMRRGGSRDERLNETAALTKANTEKESAQRNFDSIKKLQANGSASNGELKEAEDRIKRVDADITLLQTKMKGRYSKPEVDKVQAEVAQAQAAVDAAKNMLAHTNILASKSGTVFNVPVREGSFVSSGDLIVQVADLSRMQIHAFVDEPEIGRLAQGQKVSVNWDAAPGRIWEGIVTRVPTAVQIRGTRTVGEVICEVNNKDLKLIPNINVNVQITEARAENVLAIPREAVFEQNGKSYVYVVEGSKVKRTMIETALSNLTRIQVTKGLSEGTIIALGSSSSTPLTDGANIEITEEIEK